MKGEDGKNKTVVYKVDGKKYEQFVVNFIKIGYIPSTNTVIEFLGKSICDDLNFNYLKFR